MKGFTLVLVAEAYRMTRTRALWLGALFLAAMLPVLRPVILAFSPAEFFLLAIFGITFIAMLSGRSLIKGVAVGARTSVANKRDVPSYASRIKRPKWNTPKRPLK